MTQALSHTAINGSRLIRFLRELDISDVEVSHKQFAERLGQLIDLSNSITLSSAHGQLGTMGFEPSDVSRDSVRDEFLRVRSVLMHSVMKSFAVASPDSPRLKFPAISPDNLQDITKTCEPFLRFYAGHQRQMDFNIQTLRAEVRQVASGLSTTVAQLAALDKTLGDTLSPYARKSFSALPGLLERRLKHLLASHQFEALPSEEQLTLLPALTERFGTDIQGLLLAEIEARLLPVLGLIEAINETPDTDTL